jgi:N utilization substance protein A
VKRLFEAEVPEIYDGTVEIKSVAREAGERSKIAVYTANPDIDPIGSCVGPKGTRVQNVVNELNGEMIDIVEWNEDPVVFISNALSPAKVSHVKLNKEDNSALVVVPDDQLSLAIGKKGQNARLAVHLTNWKIDIKSQSEVAEEGIDLSDNDDQDDLLAMMAGEGNDESFDSDESFDTDESFDDNESFDDEDDGVKIDIEALREANEEKDTDYVKVISEDDDEESEEKPDYDPKYDEDIDYDEYDKYYD